MTFQDPLILILLVLVPLIIFNYFWRSALGGSGSIRFSSVAIFKKISPTWASNARHILIFLRAVVIFFLVVALARPQFGEVETKIKTEGIDIILALDVSSSMLAEDFQIGRKRHNRLHVVKEVVKDFIRGRENDRIGMVVFAGMAYTQCPLTLDYGVLLQFMQKVKIGMLKDGTAIGSAIGVCTDRLRKTEAKSKVLILLTDGRNNAGEIDPLTAAEISKTFKIKIYTIGAGTKGLAPFPATDIFGNKTLVSRKVDVDDDTLRKIASATDGQYFRATDTNSLKEIYKQIDALEKTQTEVTKYTEYRELFHYLVIPVLGLILFEIILANTRFRKIP